MANNETAGKRLQKLKGSDYEIADGQPDIRGWDVKSTEGNDIGKVDELIFDVQSLKVRYMVVDLDEDFSNGNSRDVLVPIGLGELHEKNDDVLLPGVTSEQLAALPSYNDDITADDEAAVRSVFGGLGVAGIGAAALSGQEDQNDFYDHGHFNEDNLNKRRSGLKEGEVTTIPVIEENLAVGKRTVQTGGAYIKSKIVEVPAEETINLQEEHVHVERTPVDRLAGDTEFNSFKEGEIELKEHAEVPVVAKTARVVEEIKIGKDVEERDETIRDTVKKTEVTVENVAGSNSSLKDTDQSTGF